ncbi:formylmethanofuran dehydrogenase [Deinococcus psychrotolerans]|uniref:Formylmethanofuran dehydrogenase n=1 Tax=Deinococcus psychrotolerans TaxID=2489213 RepID=A0A3G8YSL2_9DEIO|nr:FmdE family protein [Deinococcus psychrotolerans]AZI44216.1 formylmethanofuran dehydrogenase [Deinococcus psychrotolerans]
MTERLQQLLAQSVALHRHLCPRQVLGVRSSLLAEKILGLEFPQIDKRVLAFVETDGCFADGVAVASGCWLGHRTLRLMDYGKVAVTFVDSRTGRGVRVAPQTGLRARVQADRPAGQKRYPAYLAAYQTLPDEHLLMAFPVRLTVDLQALISAPGRRVACQRCTEEIINDRQVTCGDETLCLACAQGAYYSKLVPECVGEDGSEAVELS